MNIQKYLTPDFKKKAVIVITSVLCMGFFLSFLIDVNLGTDPCTFMNLTISGLLGLSFGNWQLLLNAVLLVFVLIADRHMIGIGTIANIIVVEQAARMNVAIGWREHAKVGVPVTLVTLALAAAWLALRA